MAQGIIGETYDHPDDPEKDVKEKPHHHPLHDDTHYKVEQMFVPIGDYVAAKTEPEQTTSRRHRFLL